MPVSFSRFSVFALVFVFVAQPGKAELAPRWDDAAVEGAGAPPFAYETRPAFGEARIFKGSHLTIPYRSPGRGSLAFGFQPVRGSVVDPGWPHARGQGPPRLSRQGVSERESAGTEVGGKEHRHPVTRRGAGPGLAGAPVSLSGLPSADRPAAANVHSAIPDRGRGTPECHGRGRGGFFLGEQWSQRL